MRRVLPLLAAALACLLTTTVLAGQAAGATGSSTGYRTIPGSGGTPLKAFVVTPNSPGKHPLLVMPSSWSMSDIEYLAQAWKLAEQSNYEVVSFTSRGFADSGGTIDIAGPKTVDDVSKVIDWALANTPADPDEIGVAGISYGAGLGLLSAANDPRIKAVAAMSGWSDLAASLYPGKTVSSQTVTALLALGNLTGRPGPKMRKLQQEYFSGDVKDAISDALKLAPARSAATKLDAINAHHPAVLMANAWQDSIFPPSQLANFFGKLTGPKRLMLSPGDHATPEIPGLAGLPNDIWHSVTRWFDHYLRGQDNGVAGENAVQLKPSNGGGWQGYPDWRAVRRGTHTSYLSGSGSLAPTASTGWHHRIAAGIDTPADSGIFELTGLLEGYAKLPPTVTMPLVSRGLAGVWAGSPYGTTMELRGPATLHTTVTPSTRNTSLFAYLYDVNQLGVGSLVTWKPLSLHGATPGKPLPVDITMEPNVWTVPAGHHLAVVVDTVDPRYRSVSGLGSGVSFGSPAGDPSWLRVSSG